jgi:hypothetical protein
VKSCGRQRHRGHAWTYQRPTLQHRWSISYPTSLSCCFHRKSYGVCTCLLRRKLESLQCLPLVCCEYISHLILCICANGTISTCICAGIRIHSTIRFMQNPDILWNAADMGMWSTAEMTGGFLVLCLPSMRKMFVESPWIQKLKTTVKSSTWSSSLATRTQQSTATVGSPSKKVRTAEEIFYSDWDKSDIMPLTTISVKSGGSTLG